MRVFLDANILFSASLAHSRLAELVEFLTGSSECLYSAYCFDEARRNLVNKFPRRLPVLDEIVRTMIRVPDSRGLCRVTLPDKDEPILSAAIASKATHLLTGDRRDFGAYFGCTLQGVKVVTPLMLAQEMEECGMFE